MNEPRGPDHKQKNPRMGTPDEGTGVDSLMATAGEGAEERRIEAGGQGSEGIGASRLDRLGRLLAFGPVELPAEGTSMGRRYPPGVRFFVAPLKCRRPLPGTLLVWENAAGELVVHRLLLAMRRRGAFRYYAKGDALRRVDASIRPDRQTVGVAVRVVFLDGREVDLCSAGNRLGGFSRAMLALPGAAVRAWQLKSRFRL